MTRFSKFATAAAAALALSVGAVGAASACKGGGYAGGMTFAHPQALERISDALELTPAQREQAQAITQNSAPELQAVHQRIREQRQALAEQTRNGFNEQGARTESAALGELVGDAAFLMSRMRADFAEILTSEQQEKLAAMKERGPRHHHRGRSRES
jgi:Spy/CpxP family protein refolding chaperone